MSEPRKYRCRVCGAEVIAGPYIAPEACGSCQLTANAEDERLQKNRSRAEKELDRLREWVAAVESGYDQQAKEIERLKALAIRAWHSFRSGLSFDSGCDCGLTNDDIEELVRLAADADAELREHPPT